jgi:hypothetical protein
MNWFDTWRKMDERRLHERFYQYKPKGRRRIDHKEDRIINSDLKLGVGTV